MELNHTIVPSKNPEESARWFAEIFGLEYPGRSGHFAPVQINDELTLLFDQNDSPPWQHYAFKVTDDEFEDIFGRVQEKKLPFGSGPGSTEDGKTNSWNGGQGVYFKSPDGHVLELLTKDH